MDFNLHFGRFFGPQIDVFEKFLLPDFELQLEFRCAKIVILSRENAIFYKIDIVGLKWESMKNMKKAGENRFKIDLFFDVDFFKILEPTWTDFGFQVGLKKGSFLEFVSKRCPRGAQGAPRASQGRLKSLQQPPKRAPRVPPSGQDVPRARPRCVQRVASLRISFFFHVFLRFPAFFFVFWEFFSVFPKRTLLIFSPRRASKIA